MPEHACRIFIQPFPATGSMHRRAAGTAILNLRNILESGSRAALIIMDKRTQDPALPHSSLLLWEELFPVSSRRYRTRLLAWPQGKVENSPWLGMLLSVYRSAGELLTLLAQAWLEPSAKEQLAQ